MTEQGNGMRRGRFEGEVLARLTGIESELRNQRAAAETREVSLQATNNEQWKEINRIQREQVALKWKLVAVAVGFGGGSGTAAAWIFRFLLTGS